MYKCIFVSGYILYVRTYVRALIYCYTIHYTYILYILYICDQQPVTVLPACPHQDQVSGIPYTHSLDHPDKLMEVGQSCDFTQCKATVKSGGEDATILQMCIHACTVPSYIPHTLCHMYVHASVQCIRTLTNTYLRMYVH